MMDVPTLMLHFSRTLSDAVSGDVVLAEFTGDVELVFGSDEEKAMVNAVKMAFPNMQHVFCGRNGQRGQDGIP